MPASRPDCAAAADASQPVLRRFEEGGVIRRGGHVVDLAGVDLSAAALDGALAALHLPRTPSSGLDWSGAALEGGSLESATLSGAHLTDANLLHGNRRRARFEGAVLERTGLVGADLASANLSAAQCGGADLTGALLEDARLTGAHLRFARLTDSCLEHADASGADLWGANLNKAILTGATLTRAQLQEASLCAEDLPHADLRNANLELANLSGGSLAHADLRGARLAGTRLAGANLAPARLDGLDLLSCDLRGVSLSAAVMAHTLITPEQIGGPLGEDLREQWNDAAKGYLALERNFEMLGDAEAASWAYRRRRRMTKHAHRLRAVMTWRRGRRAAAIFPFTSYCSDQGAEWLCDYGESIPRVLAAMVFVYLLFIGVYYAADAVVHAADGRVTHDLNDLAVFSLLAMTTSGDAVVGLAARQDAVNLLTSVQAFLGVTPFGLLGFVLGNRIRR
ncbi:MAG: pentapeptide repeat-containing protein [Acidobacteriota bacterium]